MRRMEFSLDELIVSYLLCCQSEGKSRRTIDSYRQKLEYFAALLEEHGLDERIDGIGRQEIRRFIQHLQTEVSAGENNPRRPVEDRGLSAETIAGYARTLRALWRWAVREGYLDESPMRRVRTPKVPRRAMPCFTNEEVARLLTP
jgi:integrase/recombinase XerD